MAWICFSGFVFSGFVCLCWFLLIFGFCDPSVMLWFIITAGRVNGKFLCVVVALRQNLRYGNNDRLLVFRAEK